MQAFVDIYFDYPCKYSLQGRWSLPLWSCEVKVPIGKGISSGACGDLCQQIIAVGIGHGGTGAVEKQVTLEDPSKVLFVANLHLDHAPCVEQAALLPSLTRSKKSNNYLTSPLYQTVLDKSN